MFFVSEYAPPFEITNKIISLLSEIAESLGKMSTARELEAHPHLRRNNRIRSIHSSLAIEANSLSVDEVRGVIDGRTVLGSQTEIQEVKNAYRAYDEIGFFDPFSLSELKRLHGIMTYLTVNEAGKFRSGEEGVFDGDRCIFMAPPAHLVPQLTEDLFLWMNKEKNALHPLILSSVFHYEFVFIHPFSDGNGRMARLWQTAILSQWNPLFKYLPIESEIYAFQQEYYNTISLCHKNGNSTAFIEFMMTQILATIKNASQRAELPSAESSICVQRLMSIMEYGVPYTANQLMAAVGIRSRDSFRKNYLSPAVKLGLVVMSIPDKPTSRNQTYIRT